MGVKRFPNETQNLKKYFKNKCKKISFIQKFEFEKFCLAFYKWLS